MSKLIPRKIYAIWLTHTPEIPALIQRCLESQRKFCAEYGYEFQLVTIADIKEYSPRYVRECIAAQKWAKAADFLRVWYLYYHGGIYLDADVEMIPGQTFEEMLGWEIFCGEEENNFASNAIIGAQPNHPLLLKFLDTVDRNFKGGGDLVFQPGMYLWTEFVKEAAFINPRIKIYPPEYFLPYNHHIDRLKVTENSRCIHHFNKSWID